jgi:hypothetical protein
VTNIVGLTNVLMQRYGGEIAGCQGGGHGPLASTTSRSYPADSGPYDVFIRLTTLLIPI